MSLYIGRFAPTPSGPLHMGSLLAALASYLDAKHHQGNWLLRIEDIDPPRVIEGTAERIIHSLKLHGLNWDGDIVWQSERREHYQEALAQLNKQDLCFTCECSRQALQPYNGIHHLTQCQTASTQQPPAPKNALSQTAWRFNSTSQINRHFNDVIAGKTHYNVNTENGDFVLHRKDGCYSYQLAVVVDDYLQGITHIVRGADLLTSTPMQLALQQALQYSQPHYAHIPILVGQDGEKLSKRHSAEINDETPINNLLTCLRFLNQPLPPQEKQNHVNNILMWAVEHWDIRRISQTRPMVYSS